MKHLTPTETYDFLRSHPQALFIDCRSDAEYFLVGHALVPRETGEPLRPVNVCWADELRAELNPNFVGEVDTLARDRARPVVLICRSGRRSVLAGQALEAAGYTQVTNVLHGFEGDLDERDRRGLLNGWRRDGLPWEQL